jgi:hypothetical protein
MKNTVQKRVKMRYKKAETRYRDIKRLRKMMKNAKKCGIETQKTAM